ncbi:MAG: GNAT family N-acetyltransferase [Acidimicrobiales bacterium]
MRRAGPGDLARCAELLAEAAEEANNSRGGELAEGLSERRTTVEEWAEGGILLVGEFEGTTVGLGAGLVAEAVLGDGRRLGRIECCFVETDAREVGVGEALVEELLAWFTAQGCTDVDALALPGDRRTKQLYEHSGFKARLLTLHRPLG